MWCVMLVILWLVKILVDLWNFLTDGDLLLLVQKLVVERGLGTCAITKVKGHAHDDMMTGLMSLLTLVGVECLRLSRMLGGILCRLVVTAILLFLTFTGIAFPLLGLRSMVMVWMVLLLILCYGVLALYLNVVGLIELFGIMLPSLVLGPSGLELGSIGLMSVLRLVMLGSGLFSVGSLVTIVAFLGSLRWPAEVADLGCGGVSFIELLILYERWGGGRLVPGKSLPKFRRPGRPILVSAAVGGPGADIWKLCQFLACMIRALRSLPGGLGRFIPGRIGGNQGRLRHIGWEECGHGLT